MEAIKVMEAGMQALGQGMMEVTINVTLIVGVIALAVIGIGVIKKILF
jgi:hypothetical protein